MNVVVGARMPVQLELLPHCVEQALASRKRDSVSFQYDNLLTGTRRSAACCATSTMHLMIISENSSGLPATNYVDEGTGEKTLYGKVSA